MLTLFIFQISTSSLRSYAGACRNSRQFRSSCRSNRFGGMRSRWYRIHDNLDRIVDRDLVRRQREKYRRPHNKVTAIQSLYFGVIQHKTLHDNGKHVVEEHIALLSQPGNVYIAHAVTPSNSAKDSSDAILRTIADVNVDELNAIGADGSACDVEYRGGIITRIEKHLQHKCQWIVSITNISY